MWMYLIERKDFDTLFNVVQQKGYDILGPTIQDRAIVYDHIQSVDDLPIGWTDKQEAGTYRLEQRDDHAYFGYVVGPTSWKKFLFPPKLKLWEAKRKDEEWELKSPPSHPFKLAFIGARSCELHAISIQDKVFLGGMYKDPHYQLRREDVLIVAVNCTKPAATCFCVSMNTGPKATGGFDLSLTEIIGTDHHYFVVEVGTQKGEEILKDIPHLKADKQDIAKETKLIDQARKKMGRSMDTKNIKELLYQNAEHPQWGKIADRCLSCANCTMVCPTCFCSSVEDVTDLTGDHTERWRQWDSCFTQDFSYIHGGNVRHSTKGQYRQWMTHKLASWQDQFDTSGCVGCGRCITWCPVGIDITEEVAAIRKIPNSKKEKKPDEKN